MKKTKVLLTGASGKVGSCLMETFTERFDLRTFDRVPVPGDPQAIIGDLQDRAALDRAMKGIEVLVHLAATPVERPFLEELVPNNIIGLFHTLEAAVQAKVKRVVYASTVQAIWNYYQEDNVKPVEVSALPRSSSIYGVTKAFGETLGRWYHDKYGIEFLAVRIGAFQQYQSLHMVRWPSSRDIWLSPRDAQRFFELAVIAPHVGYGIVQATSKTLRKFMSLNSAYEILGYEPQDDVRDYVPITTKSE